MHRLRHETQIFKIKPTLAYTIKKPEQESLFQLYDSIYFKRNGHNSDDHWQTNYNVG